MSSPADSAPPFSTATSIARWSFFGALLLMFILVPFALFEGQMSALVQRTFQSGMPVVLITLAVIGFLVADIVLPIPSSFVLTTAGYMLGVVEGTVVCFIGMTCASLAGYWLGRYAGGPLARRIVGQAGLERFGRLSARYGDVLLVAFRAVPVLAEASTILAGISRLPLVRFVLVVSVGNFAVSLLYAWIGAVSADHATFIIASVAAIVLPALIVLAAHRLARRSGQRRPHAQTHAPPHHPRRAAGLGAGCAEG